MDVTEGGGKKVYKGLYEFFYVLTLFVIEYGFPNDALFF
jgi:hypothetical protein